MRIRKWYYLLMAVLLTIGLCSCGTQVKETVQNTENTETESSVSMETAETAAESTADNADETATVGQQYLNVFTGSSQTEADAMTDELLEQVSVPYTLDQAEVEEGYLSGFDEEITGFQKGIMFAPMISTIPFVGYVFETEDPETLLSLLQEKANPAWNICTQADETVSASRGHLVFFLMCSNGN